MLGFLRIIYPNELIFGRKAAMLIISFTIAVVSIILFDLMRITFRREEILTKWK